jgi:tetratricopeptide (TPR) repeat protein
VDRHTPRDYDAQGNRIACPRFGTVTCGEHITAETELYEKYFEGQRVAPRHIALDLEGKEMYDIYFAWDTATILTGLRKGAEGFPPPGPRPYSDAPPLARVASADSRDRVSIEEEYRAGSAEVRRALIERTLVAREVDQIDMLRLAIFGFDVELAELARKSLALSQSEKAIALIAEALKVPMDPAEREALVAAATRLGEKYPDARTLAALHRGNAQSSRLIEVKSLPASRAPRGSYPAPEVLRNVEARAVVAEAQPEDAAARLELAESLLERSEDPELPDGFAELFVRDALDAGRQARELGAEGWRVEALQATAAALLGERDAASEHAIAAIEGGMWSSDEGLADVSERTAFEVLTLFAGARQQAIARAYRQRETWSPDWLSDIHAAHALLAEHALATDETFVSYYDFLRWLGATPRAGQVLGRALERFPGSALVHDRLRGRALWDEGAAGIERVYDELLAEGEPSPELVWFAGYASLVAAENHRRASAPDAAVAAYERAIEHYRRYLEREPAAHADVDHFACMALAGRARVELDRGNLDESGRDVLAALERSPGSAGTIDGLGLTPADTARMLRLRAQQAERVDLVESLTAAIAKLDPKLLETPQYDRPAPVARPPRGRR